jgi:hypothetical protein
MSIPTIGGARGIFEIFIPGMFLLLNLAAVAYLFPFIDGETKRLIGACASSPVLAVVVAVAFGYLLGVILRLFRPAVPDRLSAVWIARFYPHRWKDDSKLALWTSEDFPYIGLMREVYRELLPPGTQEFYDKTWGEVKNTREFFNFSKIIVSCEDKEAGDEIYAAEALSRYLFGMFYALALSFLAILVTVVLHYIVFGEAMVGLIAMLCAYLFAIGAILSRFRFVRVKEVETVFAASFKNRNLFEVEGAATGSVEQESVGE